ncbi:MAG: ATP-dependent Clp protease proteolytic subunit [Opitutaceae bacterium]
MRFTQISPIIALSAILVNGLPVSAQETGSLEPMVVETDADDLEGVTVQVVMESGDSGASAVADDQSESEDREMKALREKRDRLSILNQIAAEEQKQQLNELKAERERIALENGLAREKLALEMAEAKAALDRLSLEVEQVNKQLSLEGAMRKKALETELADMRAEEERLKLANSLAGQSIEARMIDYRLKEAEFKNEKTGLENEVARLQAELIKREKTEILEDQVVAERDYRIDPFLDGQLVVSDRRIALNGPIFQETADYVAERIAFFNNQNDEFPIFIVIDYSPGGSAMAGFKILRSMQGSEAPVYVVVKSYAASMAAAIATLAERSFAYPNAIMLHHQAATIVWGNLTQQREALEQAQKWWTRLAEPIAAKMGITLDEFIERMYQKNSDGNWSEFADEAVKLGWIDEIATNVRETSYVKNPDRFGSSVPVTVRLEERIDDKGKPYAMLPRLVPFDHYYLYNPDKYYRLP